MESGGAGLENQFEGRTTIMDDSDTHSATEFHFPSNMIVTQ